MSTFYAFCRTVDDIVDETSVPMHLRQGQLQAWRDDVQAIYRGQPIQPLAQELAPVVRKYLIPPEPLLEILTGVEMDLTKTRYETFEDLRKYCYGVASAVGLVSINIFCCQTRAAADYAIALGLAFQLTNILRDVAYDLQKFGRIYLPQEEWKTFGVTEEDFRKPTPTPGMARLLRLQYFRARHYFEKADRLIPPADRPHLSAALLMTGVYRNLLEKIRRENFEVLRAQSNFRVGRNSKPCVGEGNFSKKKPPCADPPHELPSLAVAMPVVRLPLLWLGKVTGWICLRRSPIWAVGLTVTGKLRLGLPSTTANISSWVATIAP